jgi:hypothetical protein
MITYDYCYYYQLAVRPYGSGTKRLKSRESNGKKWARRAFGYDIPRSPLLATSEAFHGPRRCNIRQDSSIVHLAAANC